MTEDFCYPGARRPTRSYPVDAYGIRINVVEWGDESSPPLLLGHGNFDFAATFDLLAPKLADAGYRVVAWDQRGHCDSGYAAFYSMEADLRDMLKVLDHVSSAPAPLKTSRDGAAA